jgi:hypothetical protein
MDVSGINENGYYISKAGKLTYNNRITDYFSLIQK